MRVPRYDRSRDPEWMRACSSTTMKLGLGIDLDAPGWLVLTVSGEVDIATAGQLQDRIEYMLDAHSSLSFGVDVSDVQFMDSTGLKALLFATRVLERRGMRLALIGVSTALEKLLRITATENLFDQYPSIAQLPARRADLRGLAMEG